MLLAWATESLGIEGLQVSVQCPDVILGWPSNPGENYIVQWRPRLGPGHALGHTHQFAPRKLEQQLDCLCP